MSTTSPGGTGTTGTTSPEILEIIRQEISLTRSLQQELKILSGIRIKQTESEKKLLSLSRKLTYSLELDNKELRRANKLQGQMVKDRMLLAQLRQEEYIITQDLSDEGKKQAAELINIARLIGTENELYRSVLENVSDIEQVEVQRAVLASIAVGSAERNLDLLNQEESARIRINKYLGVAGALTDNLQRIGLRAFGGLGINLSVFEDGLKQAKESSLELAESYEEVDRIVESVGGKANFERILSSSSSAAEELKSKLAQVSEPLVKSNREYNDFAKEAEKITAKIERTTQEYQKDLADQIARIKASTLSASEKEAKIADAKTFGAFYLEIATKADQDKLDDLNESMAKIAAGAAESASNMGTFRRQLGTLGKLMPGVGKAVVAGLLDPLVSSAFIVKGLMDAFTSLNEAQTKFRRVTGESASTFEQLTSSATNAVEVIENAIEISKAIGFNVEKIFSEKDLVRISEAKNLLELSSEQAVNLARFTKIASTNVANFEDRFAQGVKQGNLLGNSAISTQVSLKDVLSTSDDIVLSFGGSVEKLGQASAMAKSLGINLKDVDSIASSLLDFESSIENELQAQLLTGRQINLAKARELALNNDLAGVAKEVTTNIVTGTEFANMNRIAQEGLASAIGVSREQLAKMIIQQDLNNELTDIQKASLMDMTLEQYKQQTATEALKRAFTGVAQSIAGIIEPFSIFVSKNEDLVRYLIMGLGIYKAISIINKALLKIEAIRIGVANRQILLGKQSIRQSALHNVINRKGLSVDIARAGAAVAMNPGRLAASVLAVGLIGTLLYGMAKKTGDLKIDPNGGPVVSSPKEGGIFQGTKNDALAMGPAENIGLGDSRPIRSSIRYRQKDTSTTVLRDSLTMLEKKMDKFIAIQEKTAKNIEKSGNVYMDSNLVGQAVVLGSYNSA